MQAHSGVSGLSIDTPFLNIVNMPEKIVDVFETKILPINLEIIFYNEKKAFQQTD